MATELKRTPLHEAHVAAGGKLVPFAGYEMPVQYPSGITAEHRAVRGAAGLFDVSHMGEVEVWGERARDFVQHVTTNDVDRLEVGQAQYSTLPNERGTLLDDLLVYRFADHYLLVVNASNRDKDVAWICGSRRAASAWSCATARTRSRCWRCRARRRRRSSRGSPAPTWGASATTASARARWTAGPRSISRTGYTGEDGFELYVANADAAAALARASCRWARPRAWCRRASARATRCGWRWATPSTATTSTRATRRWRAGSGGW